MIVNGSEQYTTLISRMNREPHVLTPILRDLYYHRIENKVLCIAVTFEDLSTFVVSISHDDANQFDFPNATEMSYTTDAINNRCYTNNISSPTIGSGFSTYINETHTLFGKVIDANRIIPLTIWHDVLHTYNQKAWEIIHQTKNTPSVEYMHDLLNTLKRIESAGLKVNLELFNKTYEDRTKRAFKESMVYSEYNPYTITGRPSNRFGGINFSALNKTDGTRDMFISRYDGGCLVQIDFEAYHLRLIANELDINLPRDKSIHNELGKIYFGTNDISEDMYNESKRRTFEIIYGMSDETYGFDLFEKIQKIRQQYDGVSELTLPSGIHVNVEMPNASKLFNYYVQSLEVVRTAPKLKAVLDLLDNTNHHLILYTYDSILLDMENFDESVMQQIVIILEENKKFPVRIYRGDTYGSIDELN